VTAANKELEWGYKPGHSLMDIDNSLYCEIAALLPEVIENK